MDIIDENSDFQEKAHAEDLADADEVAYDAGQISIFDGEEESDDFVAWDGVKSISEKLAAYHHRSGGSENEAAAARVLRDELRGSGLAARLEAFRTYPRIGRGLYFGFGVWIALMTVAYALSFAASGLAGRLAAAAVIALFLIVSGVYVYLIFGGLRARSLLKKRVAYNVFHGSAGKRTVLIASSHGARTGSVLGKRLWKTTFVTLPLSVGVFVAVGVLRAAVGADTVAKETAFIIIPTVFGALGALSAIFRFSPLSAHAEDLSEKVSALALQAYKDLESEGLPVGLAYASFAGQDGAKAFLKEHPELEGCAVIYLCEGKDGVKYLSRNKARRLNYPERMNSLLLKSAFECGAELAPLPEDDFDGKIAAAYGFDTDVFVKAGMNVARLTCSNKREDLKDAYTLILSAARKISEMQ